MKTGRPTHPIESSGTPATTDDALSSGVSAARRGDERELLLGIIESVAKAKGRTQSIVALVDFAARQFPHSHVRCGIGTTRLRRFYDSKLGWLGPTSDLYRRAEEQWQDEAAAVPTRPALPNDPLSRSRSGGPSGGPDDLRLNLDDDIGAGRCVLWIEGGRLTSENRNALRRTLPTLRAMLWQRDAGILGNLSRRFAASGAAARVYLGLALLLFVLLAAWPVSYRVRCTTVVRPKLSRVVAAPFDATLQTAHVAPGDQVKRGDVLISLDGRPLRLELESVEAQIGQVLKERDMAMVAGRVAESQQAKLRIRELTRQRDLLSSRLQRLSVISPIDGVVVRGDLHRSIGAPLQTGQSVMEVAPLGHMIIELEVPEYEIGYVKRGTEARIRLTAADGETIEEPIGAVYPSAELRDEQNVFIAHVEVENRDGRLRPGMRGEAIAYGPIRPWLWSLTRAGWEKLLWWIGY